MKGFKNRWAEDRLKAGFQWHARLPGDICETRKPAPAWHRALPRIRPAFVWGTPLFSSSPPLRTGPCGREAVIPDDEVDPAPPGASYSLLRGPVREHRDPPSALIGALRLVARSGRPTEPGDFLLQFLDSQQQALTGFPQSRRNPGALGAVVPGGRRALERILESGAAGTAGADACGGLEFGHGVRMGKLPRRAGDGVRGSGSRRLR